MIIDGALLFSYGQSLTPLAANVATASTNQIDLSTAIDIGPVEPLKLFAMCPSLPSSATAGANITVTLQGSVDNVNWNEIEDTGPIPLANLTSQNAYLWRTQLPIFGTLYRYLQLTYTASAALSTGTVSAGIVLDVNRNPYYPRNFAA